MKRIFISQPMNNRDEKEIEQERKSIIEFINETYTNDYIVPINSLYQEDPPKNVNPGVYYLGKSIYDMASADIVVFCYGWNKARGCLIENKIAIEYDIPVIYAPDFSEKEEDV